jgi:hypothetical protein
LKLLLAGKNDELLNQRIAAARALQTEEVLRVAVGTIASSERKKEPAAKKSKGKACAKHVLCPFLPGTCMICGDELDGNSDQVTVPSQSGCPSKYGRSHLSKVAQETPSRSKAAKNVLDPLTPTEQEVLALTGDKLKSLMKPLCTTVSGKTVKQMKDKVLAFQKAVRHQQADAALLKGAQQEGNTRLQRAFKPAH